MLIKRAVASGGRLRLAFIGFCAGIAGATTFVLAVQDEDEILCLLAGWGAGLLAFAISAVLLECFWWLAHPRRNPAWRRTALSK